MRKSSKLQIAVIIIFVSVVLVFSYSYNAYVSKTIMDASYDDAAILEKYNNEIIEKLVSAESVEQWQRIVNSYDDVVIEIKNSKNEIVSKSVGRTWTVLDVKSQVPFEYKDDAYAIESSVFFLREHVAEERNLVTFLFIELLIGLSALLVLIFVIYTIMLRPYKGLYKAIEEYDETGELKKVVLKGYAGEVYKRFVSMTQNLEKQQENQRRIIASISHDIKTPLTSIMGYAERLKKDNIQTQKKERYLDIVYGKSVEIQQLVDEFDEYLSFNSPQQLKTEPVTTLKIQEYIAADYADELDNAGAKLIFSNSAAGAMTEMDIQKFKRVCGNVFSNSLKHFNKSEHIIKVNFSADKEKVYIEIHDNGNGVADEKLEIIFEPLYTSDEGRKVAGLGLSICREIIERHKGRIFARKSELGGLAVCMEFDRINKNKYKKI